MLFSANKYTRWYYNIVDRAKTRELLLNSYFEKHHIVPKSLGGNKNGRFGYKMTPEEIAHRTATMQKNKLAKKLAQENQNS